MKVRMKASAPQLHGSWYEDGDWRDYPPPGEVLETNEHHAADLCRLGAAEPVTEERKAETRPSKAKAETRTAPEKGG